MVGKCKCGQALTITSEMAGQVVECPGCRTRMRVPRGQDKSAPVSPMVVPQATAGDAESSLHPMQGGSDVSTAVEGPLPTAAHTPRGPAVAGNIEAQKGSPSPVVLFVRGERKSLVARSCYFDLVAGGGVALLLLSGFMSWVNLGSMSGPIGIKTDGIISVLAGVACAILLYIQYRGGRISKTNSVASLLCGGVGALVGLYIFIKLMSLGHGEDEDNPFAKMISSAVSPGNGVYAAILGGLAVVWGNLSLLLGPKFAWTKLLHAKLSKTEDGPR